MTHDNADIIALTDIAETLLLATRASGVTIRLDTVDDPFFAAVAEAVCAGVRSIRGQRNFGIRAAAPCKVMEEERRMIVQHDVLRCHPIIPEVVEMYGIRAQMLAPILEGTKLAGIISVHFGDGPRDWNGEDVAALEAPSERLHKVL